MKCCVMQQHDISSGSPLFAKVPVKRFPVHKGSNNPGQGTYLHIPFYLTVKIPVSYSKERVQMRGGNAVLARVVTGHELNILIASNFYNPPPLTR